jgi:hypothetical protein
MDDDLPRVTVRMLARAELTCPRRLALDHADQRANSGANRSYRVRSQIEAGAQAALVEALELLQGEAGAA